MASGGIRDEPQTEIRSLQVRLAARGRSHDDILCPHHWLHLVVIPRALSQGVIQELSRMNMYSNSNCSRCSRVPSPLTCWALGVGWGVGGVVREECMGLVVWSFAL